MEQEAANLSKRFEVVPNRAQFARDNKIRGGGSIIYQHMRGDRPISLEAAKAYAKAFRCPLCEISPRLAAAVSGAVPSLGVNHQEAKPLPPDDALRSFLWVMEHGSDGEKGAVLSVIDAITWKNKQDSRRQELPPIRDRRRKA